jgi:hypothetical protein
MKLISYALIFTVALSSCQTPDKDIRADIAGKAKEDLNFAGLQYTVHNGLVNISGRCPSAHALAKVKQTISNIHVIKEVNYNVTIEPVILDESIPIKNKVDSILADYPKVVAEVSYSYITLKGVSTAQEKGKLIKALRFNHFAFLKDSIDLVRSQYPN